MRILVIEDEQMAVDVIEIIFKKENIAFDIAMTGKDGLDLACHYDYDLILLDLMLPDMFGYDIITELRKKKINTPIIIASALSQNQDIIGALNLGADDYLTKPFDNKVLIAKIRTLLRRLKGFSEDAMQITNDLMLNSHSKVFFYNDKVLKLTTKQYQILELLALNKGRLLSKNKILDHLYNGYEEPDVEVIDSHIYQIRKKLKNLCNNNNILVKTVYGQGYVLAG